MELGFAVAATVGPDIIHASAREAEARGYHSFWVNHPGTTDGVAALAAAARGTQRIELGIGVVPLHQRGPDSITEGVHAAGLPLERLVLGVGSAGPGALQRMREGIATLRSRLPVRLVAAALGPRMCRVAGEVADGVLFNWLTPEHAARSARWVRDGAARAGRPSPKLFAYVRLALGGAARERLLGEGARYAAIPAYAAHFARMGVAPVETAIVSETPEGLEPLLRRWKGVVDQVVLRAVPPADTVEDHLALIRVVRP